MDTDERFKHLVSDPRFKAIRKRQRKVQIDERFQSMFTDERFTLKYKQDKRGNQDKKTSGDDLRKYYSLEKSGSAGEKKLGEGDDEKEEEEEEQEEEQDQANLEASDEREAQSEDGSEQEESRESGDNVDQEEEEIEDEDDTDASQLSSSSDESESDDELAVEEDLIKLCYDWQPLDHDAERADTVTKRLAIQNLDWNSIDIKDIYVLLNSIRPPLNVRLYISEFGKERLAKEEIDGPQELADMPQLDEDEEELNRLESRMKAFQNKDSKYGAGHSTHKANEYEDADEAIDWRNEEVRERLRRYQLSQMKYYYAIAEFDSPESAQAVYKELDGIEYEGSSLELDLRFVPDEVEFESADMKAECDQVPDLATYKAPQFINTALQQTTVKFTWDETDAKRQHKLNKAYTKAELEKDDLEAYLASETDSDDERNDEKYKELLQELSAKEVEKKKVDVDVRWDENEDEADAHDQADSEPNEEDADAGLDLLVMDSEKQEDFKFDPDDDRFKAVYESGLYNIDPSHPNFKRTEAFNQIAEKKREKRRRVR